jgi:hypothetical protein
LEFWKTISERFPAAKKFWKTISERFPAAENNIFKKRGTYWSFGKQYLSVSRPPKSFGKQYLSVSRPPKREAPIGVLENNI